MAELEDLYSARIIELAAAISHSGRLPPPATTASEHSKLCGSTVTIDLEVTDGRVSAYGQTVRACLLGQAACAVMGNTIVGRPTAELRNLRNTMRRMLKENGPPPEGVWSDLSVLEPVRAHKGRHASVMLVFDAVVKALDQIDRSAISKSASQ